MGQILSLADCGFGDGGKGTMVAAYADALDAHTVVRMGGPQACHNVVLSDGRAHGFSQFGAATFRRGVKTHLSRAMLVSPTHLLEEEAELRTKGVLDAFERLTIDRRAPVVTLYHRAANWIRELARGANEHGTCGMGVGETMQDLVAGHADTLFAGDLKDERTVAVKLRQIRRRKREELKDLIEQLPCPLSERAKLAIEVLESDNAFVVFLRNCKRLASMVRIVDDEFLGAILAQDGWVIFEPSQGVLLDEWYGFHPYTTWITTTFANADALIAEQGKQNSITKIGVLRAYTTRHGAGPLVTYDAALTRDLPEAHNRDDGWQGQFRAGWFDLVVSRYAIDVLTLTGGIDGLAITHLDRIAQMECVKVCTAYQHAETSRIERIILRREHDLDRQERITKRLMQCSPEYIAVPQRDYLPFLERELGVPIVATSYGRTSADKKFHGQPFGR